MKNQTLSFARYFASAVCAGLLFILSSSPAAAQDLIVSDFTGTEPAANRPWTKTSYLDPNISFTGWDFGPAPNVEAGYDNVFAFNVNAGSPPETTLAEAIAGGHYITCTISPVSGSLNLNGAKFNFSIQRIDYHTALQYAVFTSVGGFAEGDELFTTAATSKGDYSNHDHGFIMPLTGYDNLTGAMEIRIYGFNWVYSGHATSLTAFSLQEPPPSYTLTLSAGPGGSVTSDPEGTLFEENTVIQLIATPDAGYHFAGWTGDVTGKGNPRSITLTSDIAVTGNFAVNPPPHMEMGTNLGGINDYGTSWSFVNSYKRSRGWQTRATDGSGSWNSGFGDIAPKDANGWPTEVPFDPGTGDPLQFVHTVLPAKWTGTYTFSYEGAGHIRYNYPGGSWTDIYPSGGQDSLQFTAAATGAIYIEIRSTDSVDYLKNFSVVHEDFLATHETEPFHPLYMKRLNFTTNLRFMDWGRTNGNPTVTWSDRTTPDSYTQSRGQGVALEYMAQLSNSMMQDCWVCVPHQADDNYVQQMAQLLRDNVDPSLKIYVEYSNETWNTAGAFTQTDYVQDQGEALGLAPGNRWKSGQLYCSLRSVEIWEIFENEFVDDSRLVKVMGTQSANVNITNTRMEGLNDPSINPNYTMPDALAIAPYFGKNYTPADIPPDDGVGTCDTCSYPTVDEIVDTIAPQKILDKQAEVQLQKAVCDEQGMRLICYEGGQHFVGVQGAENDTILTGILHDANRDPRMYNRYLEYLDMLEGESVDLFSNFSYCDEWSKWGSWGTLEYQDQTLADAPKFQALVDWTLADKPPRLSVTDAGANLTLGFTSIWGKAYHLLKNSSTPDLNDTGWTDAGENLTGAGDLETFTVPKPAAGRIFYTVEYPGR